MKTKHCPIVQGHVQGQGQVKFKNVPIRLKLGRDKPEHESGV